MNIVESISDAWQPAVDAAPAPGQLIALERWAAIADTWPQDITPGLLLPNDVDPREIGIDLGRFATIALQFPKWTDGRAYTQARLLRRRLRWGGELRAVGDVVVDIAPLLARVGFDVAVLRPGQDPKAARGALRFFDGGNAHYQGDARDPRPLFQKQAPAQVGGDRVLVAVGGARS